MTERQHESDRGLWVSAVQTARVSVKTFRTCRFLWSSRGATHSKGYAPVLVEAVEGVPLSTGNHLNTGEQEMMCIHDHVCLSTASLCA